MKQTLSYVIATPYTVVKSRTGGVISRLLSRVDLELVGAQMIALDEEYTQKYADMIRHAASSIYSKGPELVAKYVERNLGPSGGRRHRSLLMVFRGENPCEKLSQICGALFQKDQSVESVKIESLNLESLHGETIRDTYADLVYATEDPEKIIYFEPAVLTPRIQEYADDNLALFAKFLKKTENIVSNLIYPDPSKIERTLAIIKPDNWKYASSKPGAIIDMFSRTGLRIVGMKVHRFSLKQALDFYGPVESALIKNLGPRFGKKALDILQEELKVRFGSKVLQTLTESVGVECAQEEFHKIIEFMSGLRPDDYPYPSGNTDEPGNVMCMIMVYEGEDAIRKIRDVLGPTDPLKAPSGTVRREFGSNIMVNTAHASDSHESYEREKDILRLNENSLEQVISDYLKSRR
ncbi:MAG: nucleoside-diphosphate kinase [Treponema sp.]|nr:nucleoside-diphosphate kinase [Treponema sp.]